MSEHTPVAETILIPGEPTMSNPVPPPFSVQLPIVTWPHEFKNALLGLNFLFVGLFSLLTVALIGFGFGASLSHVSDVHLSWQDAKVFLILLVCLPLMLYLGVSFTGSGITCLRDAAWDDPVLEITADGLRDRRSGLVAPWSSIRSAKPMIHAVDLQLSDPAKNWQNPFRIGIHHQRRPQPGHVFVSVANLQTREHVLKYTILMLVQSHGGEVISKLPSGLEIYPRLLPRSSPRTINRPASVL